MAVFLQRSAFLEAIQKHNPSSTAVVNHDNGTTFSYGTLLHDIACAKEQLARSHSKNGLAGERVAFLVENGYDYVGMNMLLVARLYCTALTLLADSHLTVCICMQRYRRALGTVVPNQRAEAHSQQQRGGCSVVERKIRGSGSSCNLRWDRSQDLLLSVGKLSNERVGKKFR
jgi:hypothetical protein